MAAVTGAIIANRMREERYAEYKTRAFCPVCAKKLVETETGKACPDGHTEYVNPYYISAENKKRLYNMPLMMIGFAVLAIILLPVIMWLVG